MGVELKLQVIPADCALLRRARRNGLIAEYIQHIHIRLEEGLEREGRRQGYAHYSYELLHRLYHPSSSLIDWLFLGKAHVDSAVSRLFRAGKRRMTGRKGPYEIWDEPMDRYIEDATQSLGRVYPNLLQHYFYDAARRFDLILYLLSPERRRIPSQDSLGFPEWERETIVGKAFFGSEQLHPQGFSTQGFPIGLVPPDDVKLIADYFQQVTYTMFEEYFDPPNMRDASIYKFWPDGTKEERRETLDLAWNEFQEMRDFYQAAAAHGEAVITVID